MKFSEPYLKKLIKEVLSQNLLIERKTDKFYDIVSNFFISKIKDFKNSMVAVGRSAPHPNGKLLISYGSKTVNRADFIDARYFKTDFYKALREINNYFKGSYQTNDQRLKTLLDQWKPHWGNIAAQNGGFKSVFIYIFNPELVNKFSNELYEQIKDDSFLNLETITGMIDRFALVFYPDLGTAGGSMGSKGNLNINSSFQSFSSMLRENKLPTPPKLPPLPKPPPSFRLENDIMLVSDILWWMYYCTSEEHFNKYLAGTGYARIERMMIHEIAHFINASRALQSAGKLIQVRDSGLGIKSLGAQEDAYALSTEELVARIAELKDMISKMLNHAKIIAFPPGAKFKSKQEKLNAFYKGLEMVNPTNATLLIEVIKNLALKNKSKAVNVMISADNKYAFPMKHSGAPNASGVFLPNIIQHTIFRGSSESDIWQSKEGQKRISRVYQRMIDLVDLIDNWLKSNGFL